MAHAAPIAGNLAEGNDVVERNRIAGHGDVVSDLGNRAFEIGGMDARAVRLEQSDVTFLACPKDFGLADRSILELEIEALGRVCDDMSRREPQPAAKMNAAAVAPIEKNFDISRQERLARKFRVSGISCGFCSSMIDP